MNRQELEAWADQLLDQHRTAPKGAAQMTAPPAPATSEAPAQHPETALDADAVFARARMEQALRIEQQQEQAASVQRTLMIGGGIVLVLLVLAFLSTL